MSRAVIAIADTIEGRVDVKVTHVNGFDNESNAHKLSIQILKWMDEQCAAKELVPLEEEPAAVKEFHQRMTAPILVPR